MKISLFIILKVQRTQFSNWSDDKIADSFLSKSITNQFAFTSNKIINVISKTKISMKGMISSTNVLTWVFSSCEILKLIDEFSKHSYIFCMKMSLNVFSLLVNYVWIFIIFSLFYLGNHYIGETSLVLVYLVNHYTDIHNIVSLFGFQVKANVMAWL